MKTSKRTYLVFGEKNLDHYKQLGRELGGLGKELMNRDVFLIAMSWGYRYGTKVDEFKKSATGVRLEFLKDEDLALMAAVQLKTTGDPESLKDVEQRFDLAEQYAEGGILLLAKMMEEPGDFAKTFAAEIKQQSASLAAGE